MIELLQTPLFIIFASLTLVAVLPSLAHYWYKAHKAGLEASLKEQMIQRGMSADDIRQVLEASADGTTRKSAATRCRGE